MPQTGQFLPVATGCYMVRNMAERSLAIAKNCRSMTQVIGLKIRNLLKYNQFLLFL